MKDQKLEIINKAIDKKKLLKFDYVSQKFEITTRLVEPQLIHNFILVANDLDKGQIRQFQIDGIQKPQIINKEKHANTNE